MSASNKLIEAVAERYVEAMTEILTGAAEVGDHRTLEQVAEVFRDTGDYVFVVQADKLAAFVNGMREGFLLLGQCCKDESRPAYEAFKAAFEEFDKSI